MSDNHVEESAIFDRIEAFVNASLHGKVTDIQLAETEQLLRENEEAQGLYIELVEMAVYLPRALVGVTGCKVRAECGHAAEEMATGETPFGEETRAARSPAVVFPVSSPPVSSFFGAAYRGTAGFFSQETPLGILMATIFMIVGGVIGWHIPHKHYTQMPGQSASSAEQSYAAANAADKTRAAIAKAQEGVQWVGRITGMVDCKWSADEDFLPPGGNYVSLGRKYKLDSGLMEITYYTGAKVILQGPCTYEVDSAAGGYLSLGKLTARCEKKGAGEEKVQGSRSKVQNQTSESLNLPSSPQPPAPSPSSLATSHSPLFTVKTPTAIVTDLGTEFGVEVDKAGMSQAHVFQGMVEMRTISAGKQDGPPIILRQNDSARVDVSGDHVVRVIRNTSRPEAFSRQMVRPPRIQAFSTGMGLKVGDQDPHWQIVGRSDVPNFAPRPAVVVRSQPLSFAPNDPAKSQAISIGAGDPASPGNVVYTFRTTFDVAEKWRDKAALQVDFAAHSGVAAIRLNGRDAPLPKRINGAPSDSFLRTAISDGFAVGTNVLEIDVIGAAESSTTNAIALRARLTEISRVLARAARGNADGVPSVVDVTGLYSDPNGVIGGANTANMTGDAAFGWLTSNCDIPVYTNGFTFTLNNGDGNKAVLHGEISGSGNVVFIGRNEIGSEYWDSQELWLSGTEANTYAGTTTLNRGTLHLNKPDGVDAIPGDLNITGDDSSNLGQILWVGAGNQINDKANVAFVGKAAGNLNLNGHSETFNSLSLTEGSTVHTGQGGVLTLNALTVNGAILGPGKYDSSHPFVTGTGHILVLPERRQRL